MQSPCKRIKEIVHISSVLFQVKDHNIYSHENNPTSSYFYSMLIWKETVPYHEKNLSSLTHLHQLCDILTG